MSAGLRLVAALEAHGRKVKPAGRGKWLAQCPAHDDRNPSLSIGELPDGRILIHCHAGCGGGEVVGAIGMRLSDLYPDGANGEWGPMWWASNRNERTAKESTDRHASLVLEICHAKRERGEILSAQDLKDEREAYKKINMGVSGVRKTV